MIVAQQKRRENIVEYILYMWNVEDLIRANGLDMGRIDATVMSKYSIDDPARRAEVRYWWENLCEMMRREGKETGGHLQILTMLANDLYNFHLYLLTQESEIPYQNAFRTAWPDLSLFMNKTPGGDKMHHVLLALSAIYDYYLLKLRGETVLADTTNAMVRIGRFMAMLSQKYLKAERELHADSETSPDGNFVATRQQKPTDTDNAKTD